MGANVLIMAGGTGGHVFPALACAREFQNRGYTVHWLGTHRVTGGAAAVRQGKGVGECFTDSGGQRH